MAERVHAGDTDAVQSAGNFVGRGVELSARVQHGHHDLRRGQTLAINIHLVGGNAAAVVDDGDGVVDVNGDVDAIGESRQRFVDRVVDHFVDEVMQSHLAGRADVHGGTLAHRFHAAQNLDGICGVVSVGRTVAVLPVVRGKFFVLNFEWFVLGSRRSGGLGIFRGHPAPIVRQRR